VVEGDSSLTAHSVFANNLLQKLVDQDADLELRDTLETLRHLVDAMKKQPAAYEMTYPNVKAGSPSASEAFRQCELPPIQQTVQMLNLAKGTSTDSTEPYHFQTRSSRHHRLGQAQLS
jgi:hypothetical protein